MTKSKQPNKNPRILIVGQGIAGTVLAHTLLQRSIDVTIIDNGHKSAASKVASGTYSPLVLKRLVKSWEIDSLLPYAFDFYKMVEHTLELPLIKSVSHYRKIAQESEVKQWEEKYSLEEMKDYVGPMHSEEALNDHIKSPFGYGEVLNSGHVNMENLIDGSRQYFSDFLREEEFEYSNVEALESNVSYCGEDFDKVIFCEGYKVGQNPFFQHAALKPVKGETLYVHIPNLNLKHVIKSNIYILPQGNDIYAIGSTYDWENLDERQTQDARLELLAKLKDIIDYPYNVIQQKAGVRPSSKDRRPIIGKSRINPNLFIFNGLGAKGLILSPFFASMLCDHILDNKNIDPMVNLDRFLIDKS
ncbi:MAG: glycine oxidase [Patiriisocius sp.]|jgi:glycine oxidase